MITIFEGFGGDVFDFSLLSWSTCSEDELGWIVKVISNVIFTVEKFVPSRVNVIHT
jgi:hypothetical protein